MILTTFLWAPLALAALAPLTVAPLLDAPAWDKLKAAYAESTPPEVKEEAAKEDERFAGLALRHLKFTGAAPSGRRSGAERDSLGKGGTRSARTGAAQSCRLAALPRTISLDASVAELATALREIADAVATTEGTETLADLLADAPEDRPETQIVYREAQRALWDAVSSVLTARGAEVVALHYRGVSGESDDSNLNLSEIAVRLGTTRQNVHDTHMRALRKLNQRLPGEVVKEIIAV